MPSFLSLFVFFRVNGRLLFFFFFSSRRRHTIWNCDWSSDVCSSDLFDAAKHQLSGERTGQRYRLGDRVQVRVVKVDMESTKVDFVLHETVEEAVQVQPSKAARPVKAGRKADVAKTKGKPKRG